jgi:hypothetical protein
MPPLVPPRFLVRVAHPCKYVKAVPRSGRGDLLDLPVACRLDNFAAADGAANFADVRLAWHPRPNLEIAIVGQNLVQDRHLEYRSSSGAQEIPRSFYGKVTWRF